MVWKELTKSQCEEIISTTDKLEPDFDAEYQELYDGLAKIYKDIAISTKNKYKIDYLFGLSLYSYLRDANFTLRDASNDDVWRYLSVKVFPQQVASRWNGLHEDRLYKLSRRIWLKTLWWYIHLSWAGSVEETTKVVEGNSTDEIMQLVERSGKGYLISLYRQIMLKYSLLDSSYKKRTTNIFRKVLILNTAMIQTVEPCFFSGGLVGYVDYLFNYFIDGEKQ
ncbi:hypothetical protein EDD63_1065 [Breznakia blatticola]|uniref:Uncharacterized protein n=1 Tax=Breznakia blatticola TaxID=1754012 RepID=A0A4V3G912_9FIRM|nr:hypothetical protein [Breznakia blatticola]TDW25064.1 hypothetical protein EDD63_1065 [Breznakia blatticola]